MAQSNDLNLVLSYLPDRYKKAYAKGLLDDNDLLDYGKRHGLIKDEVAPAPKADFSNVVAGQTTTVPDRQDTEAPDSFMGALVDKAKASLQRDAAGLIQMGSEDVKDAPVGGGVLGSPLEMLRGPLQSLSDATGATEAFAPVRQSLRDYAADLLNRSEINDNRAEQGVNRSLENDAGPLRLGKRAVADLAGSPESALSVFGGPTAAIPGVTTYAQRYAQARKAGLSADEADKSAKHQAYLEAGISVIPAGKFLEKIPGLKGAVQKIAAGELSHDAVKYISNLGKNVLGEGFEESITQLGQFGADKLDAATSDSKAAKDFAESNLPKNLVDMFDQTVRSGLAGMAGGASLGSVHAWMENAADRGKLASKMVHGQVSSELDINDEHKAAEKAQADRLRGTQLDLFGQDQSDLPTFDEFQTQRLQSLAQEALAKIEKNKQVDTAYDQNNRRKTLDILTSDGANNGNIMADALQRAGTDKLARLPEAPKPATPDVSEPVQNTLPLNEPVQPAEEAARKQQLDNMQRRHEATKLIEGDNKAIENKAKSLLAADRRKAQTAIVEQSRSIENHDQRVQYIQDSMAEWESKNPLDNYITQVRGKHSPATKQMKGKVAPPKFNALNTPVQEREEDVKAGEDDNSPIRPDENLKSVDELKKSLGMKQAGQTPMQSNLTTEDVIDHIGKKLRTGGAKVAAKLIGDKNLVIVDDASNIPSNGVKLGDTAGFYDGKRTYVVANQLDANNIMGDLLSVAAHETHHAANHSGKVTLAGFVGKTDTSRLRSQIEKLADTGNVPAFAAVKAARAAEKENPGSYEDELLGYFINAARETRGGLAKSVLKNITSAVRTKFGTNANITPDDVAYMSDKLLKAAAYKGERLTANLDRGMQMYVGEKAKLSPVETQALEQAQKLDEQGRSQEMIRQATGWFKNPHDGKWRREISDRGAKFKIPFEDVPESELFQDEKKLRLGDVLDHPELFAKYPDLADMQFTKKAPLLDIFKAIQGWFDEEKNAQAVTPYALNPLSTMLHETQHAVQAREGFARGGNEESVWNNMNNEQLTRVAQAAYDDISQQRDAEAAKLTQLAKLESWPKANEYRELTEEIRRTEPGRKWLELDAKRKELTEDARRHIGADSRWRVSLLDGSRQFLEDGDVADLDKKKEESRKKVLDLNGKIHDIQTGGINGIKKATKGSKVAYDLYRAIAGEIEARDVQARQNLTDEERKDTQPYTSEKFNPEDVIVTHGKPNDEAAMSVDDSFNDRLEKKKVKEFRDGFMSDVKSRAKQMQEEAESDGRHRFEPGDEVILAQSGRRIRILAKMLMNASDKSAREQFGEKQYEKLSFNEKLKLKKLLRKEPGYLAETTDFRSDAKGNPLDDQPEGAYRTMIYDWGIRGKPEKFGSIPGGKGMAFNLSDFREAMGRIQKPDNKAIRFLKSQFDYKGGLGKELNEMREDSVGSAALEAHRAMNAFGRINSAVRTIAASRGLDEAAVKKQINDKLDAIASIDGEDRRAAALAAWVRDNPHFAPVQDAINEVNQLSKTILGQMLIAHPDPTPAQLRLMNTIHDNMFRYATRMYAAFQGEAGREHSRFMIRQYKAAKKALAAGKNVPEKYRQNFETYTNAVKYLIDHDLIVPEREGLEALSTDKLGMLFDTWVGNAREERQRLRAAAIAEGLNKPQQDAFIREAIIGKLDERRGDINEAQLQGKADDLIKGMLGLNESAQPFATFYRGFTQDRTILEHREHLPEEIRALFGEIKDPAVRLAVTIAKQGELAARTRLLLDMRDQGKGKWVIPPEDAGLPGNDEFNVTLKGKNYGPLNGWRTNKTVASAIGSNLELYSSLTDALAKSYTNTDAALQAIGRQGLKGVKTLAAWQKLASIVWDFYNIGNNFVGSPFQAIANGVYNPKHYIKGGKVGLDVIADAIFDNAGRLNPEYEDAIKYGLLDSARVQEIRATPQRVIRDMISDESKVYRHSKSAVRRGARGLIETFAMSDAWTKVASWMARVDHLKEYYKAEGIDKSDEEIKREAADEMKNTNITYARVPPIMRTAESIGLTTFMPYFYSVPRVIANNYILAVKDLIRINASKSSAGKALMLKSATARLAGNTVATAGLTYLLHGLSAAIAGDDKDKEDEMKKLMNQDARFADSIYLGKDAAGVPLFFRISRIDPFGPVNDIMRVYMNNSISKADKNRAALNMLEGLVFSNRVSQALVKSAASFLPNVDVDVQKRSRIQRFAPAVAEKAKDALTALPRVDLQDANNVLAFLDSLTPGILDAVDPTNTVPKEIKGNDPWLKFLGQMAVVSGGRLDRADPGMASYVSTKALEQARKDGRQRMADGFNAGSSASDLMKRYIEASTNEYLAMRQVQDTYDGMTKGLGMTPRQASEQLKDGSKLTAADIAAVRQGRVTSDVDEYIKHHSGVLNKSSLEQRDEANQRSLSPEEKKERKKAIDQFLKNMQAMGLKVNKGKH